jgi:hypothetical protein
LCQTGYPFLTPVLIFWDVFLKTNYFGNYQVALNEHKRRKEEEEEEEDRLTVILDSPPEIMSVLSKKLLTVNVMG